MRVPNLQYENPKLLMDENSHDHYGLGEKTFVLGQVLAYICLSASLILMFVHAKKTEVVPEIS